MANLKMGHYVVAFIDILGASSMIESQGNKSLNQVHKAYEDTLSFYKEIISNSIIMPELRIFSDNIVIYKRSSNKKPEMAFRAVIVFSCLFQSFLLCHNILTRGGIAEGPFWCDDLMIWGKALVDAYAIESSVAIYPRVVVSEALCNRWWYGDKESIFHKLIQEDTDGMKFIDYLNPIIFGKKETTYHNIFLQVQKRVEDAPNMIISQKVCWLNRYVMKKYDEFEKLGEEDENS